MTGTIDKQRTCLRCGGPIRAANVNGYCSQSKECIVARNKALREREYDKSREHGKRYQAALALAAAADTIEAKARALANSPDEAKMLENNMRWYAEYVADRRRRGIPEKGLPVEVLRS